MPYANRADQAASSRRHYEANRAKVKARAREHSRAQTIRLREIVIKAKHVPCADCGGRFPTCAMDFDHAGEPKDDNIADMVRKSVSVERLRAEMAKCDVVCANCHRVRTVRSRA